MKYKCQYSIKYTGNLNIRNELLIREFTKVNIFKIDISIQYFYRK